jgi:hypothetical protein
MPRRERGVFSIGRIHSLAWCADNGRGAGVSENFTFGKMQNALFKSISAKSDRVPRYIFTMRLPRFSPASSPISACGVFSSPVMMSSWTLILPAFTHD